jgi:F0F1-type ATP synthase assembly protein I
LRRIALIIAAVVVVASVVVLIVSTESHPTRFIVAAAGGAIALFGRIFGVRPQWVRSSADLYAARLLEATETLARDRS